MAERTRYGSEHTLIPLVRLSGVFADDYDYPDYQRREAPCHDCGAQLGEFHVPGCDWEKCTVCGWQAIACWCEDKPSG